MIRVLHIMNGAHLGGISTLVLNYYRRTDRNAVQFDFACTSSDPVGFNGKELQKLGSRFFQLPLKSRHPLAHARALRALLRQEDYRIVHVHGSLTSFFDLAVAKQLGIPVRIAHSHSAVPESASFLQRRKRALYAWLNRRCATALLACSRDAVVFAFGKKALSDPRCQILVNAIDCERFAYREALRTELRMELGIPEGCLTVGSVGRIGPEKNYLFLIRLLPELLRRHSEIRLLLVGDGKQRPEAEGLVRELGLTEQVIFTGSRSDVWRILNAMDVFVVPSLHEGFCIAALEAGTNGLPLVLSDGVPKDLGFFSNVRYLSLQAPAEEWAEAILTGAARDPQGAERAAQHGFDVSDSAKRLEALYRSSLQERSGRPAPGLQ